MCEKKYNGWSNYETWNVKLWIDNDGSLTTWEDRARELIADVEDEDGNLEPDDREEIVTTLANELERETMEGIPHDLTGCYRDILVGNLQSVDWREIAESIISNVQS